MAFITKSMNVIGNYFELEKRLLEIESVFRDANLPRNCGNQWGLDQNAYSKLM